MRFALACLTAIAAQGGMIRGVVLEHVFLWPQAQGSADHSAGQNRSCPIVTCRRAITAWFDLSLGEIDADLMDSADAQTLPVAASQRIASDVRLIALPGNCNALVDRASDGIRCNKPVSRSVLRGARFHSLACSAGISFINLT